MKSLNWRWRGLTLQVFVFVVLPLAALLVAVSLGSLSLHGQAMPVLVGERDQRAVQAAAAAISEQLTHRAAARYASARSLDVSATFKPAELIVRVRDDGQGFAASERVSDLAASGHYGLMGM